MLKYYCFSSTLSPLSVGRYLRHHYPSSLSLLIAILRAQSDIRYRTPCVPRVLVVNTNQYLSVLYVLAPTPTTPVTTNFDHSRAPGNTTTVSPHQFMGARRTRGIRFVICCLAFVLGLHHCSANGNTPSKFHHINTAKSLNMPTNLMILTPSIRPKPKHTRPNPPIYCCPCASLNT
jgi:hypothetical protein